MPLYPIWQDYYVNVGDHDKADFSVEVYLGRPDGQYETIYQGTAHRKPGDASLRIRINDICADWLAENLGTLDDETLDAALPLTFRVRYTPDGSGSAASVGNIVFINDWSYDYGRSIRGDGMSDPIDGRADRMQPLPFTSLNDTLALIVYLKDGTCQGMTVTADDVLSEVKGTDLGRALRTAGYFTALIGDASFSIQGSFDFTAPKSLNPPQSEGSLDEVLTSPSTSPVVRLVPNGNVSIGFYDSSYKDGLMLQSGQVVINALAGNVIESMVVTCPNASQASALGFSAGTPTVDGNVVTVAGPFQTTSIAREKTNVSGIISKIDVNVRRTLAFSELEAIKVQDTGAMYSFADTCARYALYYVNAYGGWDTLVMDGIDEERDGLTRHEASRVYDNTDMQNRGTVNYVNEIQKSWTLRTGYLTDEQAGRMHHLLNSVQVYLYEMESGSFLPVVLTGTSTEYKTYRNQGRKLVSYEIQVRLAQDRIRR